MSVGAVVALLICAVVMCCRRRAELGMRSKSHVVDLSLQTAPMDTGPPAQLKPGKPPDYGHM